MMPGEKQQCEAGGITASEATNGTCHNCTVLSQNLDEYVTALLTVKQKIIDTDLLLSEYKEKCDELQKSQRESMKLHIELDEVLLKLGPLEKQTTEYEAVRAELEETMAALKVYKAKSEELDALKEENTKALAVNAKLEETLKNAEDAAKIQSIESTKLRTEKNMLENDLQKTQESLKQSQWQGVEDVENLTLQNAKTLILKSNLENQLLALEDTNLKQHHTIQELQSKNSNLEQSIRLTEEKLATLEKEFSKEKRCSSTQTENEPKVDKAKVWTLLQQIWCCVDPLSKNQEYSGLNDNQHLILRPSRSPSSLLPVSPFRNLMPQSTVSTPKSTKVSPDKSLSESSLISAKSPDKDRTKRETGRKKKRSLDSEIQNESSAKTDEISDLSLNKDDPADHLSSGERCSKTADIWDICRHFCPLPAALSPLPPDELAKMEVNSSLKDSSVSESADSQKSQSTEPKPSEDSVAVSSVCLSQGNLLSMMTSSVSPDPDNTHLQEVFAESQELQVEQKKGNSEDSPCTLEPSSLQNESDQEPVSLNQVTVTEPKSQLSTMEECTNQINSKPQCTLNPEELANCNDGVRQGSVPVQWVVIPEVVPDKDESVQSQSEIKPNVCEVKVYPGTCSETEGTVEEISTPVVPTTVLKTAEDQSHFDGQASESSCTKIGVMSGDSSDEDEFIDLKRKVNGNCMRPVEMDSIDSNTPLSEGDQEPVERVQGTNCETKELHQADNEKGDSQKDGSIAVNMCEPVALEEKQEVDPRNPLPVSDDQHEENAISIYFGSNIENMDGGLNESEATPNHSSVNPQDRCPTSSVNTPTMSSVNLPLADVASRNVPTSYHSPESIGKVLTEMGPPLPPLVLPLAATPTKCRKHLTPNRPSIQSPTWSSTEGPICPVQQLKVSSPSHGVPSSPLQFGSATPKHALPVPGRLPSSAVNSSSPSASQENSMQMLDTMYPELSAQARTLNILRGNVNLGRAANESGTSPPSVNPISGNKTINSSSTAFTKTDQKSKRIGPNVLLPKSAKRLRLDTCSPDPSSINTPEQHVNGKPGNGVASTTYSSTNGPSSKSQIASKEGNTVDVESDTHSSALEKLQNSCFDLLPVIRSHVFLDRISQVPVLRDEEKSVISDFCSNQSIAEEFMLAILSKIKVEKAVMKHELLQSHCRVYVGLCRWRGDCQKAHALAYSLLKEDFPEAPKLILFMVTTWPTLLSNDSPLCLAIKTVIKLKAEGEILDFLSKYLHWDERPPGDIHQMITTILKSLLEDSTLIFQKHSRHGDDLCHAAWEYIFSLELLCTHLGWKWTHDNIIGKELWPVMNTWVTQPRSQQTPVRDICVAAVLRLIGRLCQLGIKEKLCTSVQNVAKAMNLFGKHGISEGVPWEVQLSAVYTIYDLAPSNPKEALEALASWRGEITQPVPPAVTSCITQIGSICRQIKY